MRPLLSRCSLPRQHCRSRLELINDGKAPSKFPHMLMLLSGYFTITRLAFIFKMSYAKYARGRAVSQCFAGCRRLLDKCMVALSSLQCRALPLTINAVVLTLRRSIVRMPKHVGQRTDQIIRNQRWSATVPLRSRPRGKQSEVGKPLWKPTRWFCTLSQAAIAGWPLVDRDHVRLNTRFSDFLLPVASRPNTRT